MYGILSILDVKNQIILRILIRLKLVHYFSSELLITKRHYQTSKTSKLGTFKTSNSHI